MCVSVFQCVAAGCVCCHYCSAVVFFKCSISFAFFFCLSFIRFVRIIHIEWFFFHMHFFSLSFWLAHAIACLRARCKNHTLYKISWTWPNFISSFYDFVAYSVHFCSQSHSNRNWNWNYKSDGANANIQLQRAVQFKWAFDVYVVITQCYDKCWNLLKSSSHSLRSINLNAIASRKKN